MTAASLRLEPVSIATESHGLKYTYFQSDYHLITENTLLCDHNLI